MSLILKKKKCCCGCETFDFDGNPITCPEVPTITATFSGITAVARAAIMDATAGVFSAELPSAPDGAYTLTQTSTCALTYSGTAGTGMYYDEESGPFDPETGEAIGFEFDLIVFVTFTNNMDGTGDVSIGVTGEAAGFSFEVFFAAGSWSAPCARSGSGSNTLASGDPIFASPDVKLGYDGSVTLAAA